MEFRGRTVPSDSTRQPLDWLRIAAVAFMCVSTVPCVGWAQTPRGERWIEFEVNEQKISGFVVGYFVPGKSDPAFVSHVQRADARSPQAGIMRLLLIQGRLPAGETFVVRIRTVVGDKTSDWSTPSAPFIVSATEGQSSPRLTAPEKPSRPAKNLQSAVSELERDPAIRAKILALFPGRDLTRDAVGFRNTRDLVAALYAASNLKIRFEDIKRLTADAGSRNLQKAIGLLRPDADAKAEARRAQRESKKVFAKAPPSGP